MKCIFCGNEESKVIDSRTVDELNAIKRRRECLGCGKRFTTFETVEVIPVMVIKSDGQRQPFSPSKVKAGIVKACEKRAVSMKDIDALVADIEKKVYGSMQDEISSKQIGEYVCEGLKTLDDVAYVRFASVYRQFKDLSAFSDFLHEFQDFLGTKD